MALVLAVGNICFTRHMRIHLLSPGSLLIHYKEAEFEQLGDCSRHRLGRGVVAFSSLLLAFDILKIRNAATAVDDDGSHSLRNSP